MLKSKILIEHVDTSEITYPMKKAQSFTWYLDRIKANE